jgi:hypothetical protein
MRQEADRYDYYGRIWKVLFLAYSVTVGYHNFHEECGENPPPGKPIPGQDSNRATP